LKFKVKKKKKIKFFALDNFPFRNNFFILYNARVSELRDNYQIDRSDGDRKTCEEKVICCFLRFIFLIIYLDSHFFDVIYLFLFFYIYLCGRVNNLSEGRKCEDEKQPKVNWLQHANALDNISSRRKFLSANFLYSLESQKPMSMRYNIVLHICSVFFFIMLISYSHMINELCRSPISLFKIVIPSSLCLGVCFCCFKFEYYHGAVEFKTCYCIIF
jgi:hypothetical protein